MMPVQQLDRAPATNLAEAGIHVRQQRFLRCDFVPGNARFASTLARDGV
jgi:hypothetical protein